MSKTTKCDGMERRAERWLESQTDLFEETGDKQIKSLTRLLRKVAREARKQALDEIEALDPLMSICCGEWERADDIALGVQNWLVKTVRNRRSA